MKIGIDSFVAAVPDALEKLRPVMLSNSKHIEPHPVSKFDFVDTGENLGSADRLKLLDSAPETILAAAAVRTERIRLTSAVTVLSANDPVRVFQQFATIDLLSRGRQAQSVSICAFARPRTWNCRSPSLLLIHA
jgi:Luciferase-like monooxygenase